jgi:hypothetical protein
MRTLIVAAVAALLAACGSEAADREDVSQGASIAPGENAPSTIPASASVPDLAACPRRAPVDDGLRQRSKAIPVPTPLGEVMRSDVDNLAVALADGGTVCVDASWMESIRDAALSADQRFASFSWDGYESYGHVIVDRSGKGQVIDTGVPPVASPSGELLAAADLSESGFGALSAFAVWRIQSTGLRQLTSQEDLLEATDWRIEDWSGEACVNLTAVAWENSGDASPRRERFRSREGNGWRFEPGRCGDA